jgi:hypothetical protein
MNLEDFRTWHLSNLLNREQFSLEDQELLLIIENGYGDLQSGAAESMFKNYVKCLIPKARQSQVNLIEPPSPSLSQPVTASGTYAVNYAEAAC